MIACQNCRNNLNTTPGMHGDFSCPYCGALIRILPTVAMPSHVPQSITPPPLNYDIVPEVNVKTSGIKSVRKNTNNNSINSGTQLVLILLGLPLGYIGSYFAQPGIFKLFISLGDYIVRFNKVLSPTALEVILNNAPNPGGLQIERSIIITAWAGIILGPILVSVLLTIFGSKAK